MISYDRLQELRMLADRGNSELGELLDGYQLAQEYIEATDLSPDGIGAEFEKLYGEIDRLELEVDNLEVANDDLRAELEETK